jgi:hypothetical protein
MCLAVSVVFVGKVTYCEHVLNFMRQESKLTYVLSVAVCIATKTNIKQIKFIKLKALLVL